jgi:Protein of unknown function (DUF2971)
METGELRRHNQPLPQTLFKYVSKARADVLQNLKIRYTQVSALNDPFESLPAIIKKDRASCLRWFSERVESEIERLQIRSESKKKQYRRARKKEFPAFFKHNTDEDWLVSRSEYVQRMTDSVQGMLSLTGTPTNILMWSHYAENHTGFVIGFHAEHDYFGKRVTAVTYSDDRPACDPFVEKHSGELFYTKSTDWSYEKEFRKYQPLVETMPMANGHAFLPYKKQATPAGCPIVLFPFPKECIECVILGWKSPAELKANVEEALKRNDIHVPIRKAHPSPTRYEMVIRDLGTTT